MNRSKIEWTDWTWNPVTGCLHGCPYCYARAFANRFAPRSEKDIVVAFSQMCYDHKNACTLRELTARVVAEKKNGKMGGSAFPFGFEPTLHRYRLFEPQHVKEPGSVFVCSMADLFGDWVPDQWINAVFDACRAAPQHRYLFLTKNPRRYMDIAKVGELPTGDNFWYGTTITTTDQPYFRSNRHNCFLSIEPIFEDFGSWYINSSINWVIVGAETGNRKGKVTPQKGWIDNIAFRCSKDYRMYDSEIPLFMKNSLRDLMGNDFRQEFPWEIKQDD